MATVFQHFSEEKTAFINPGDTTKPVPGFPEVFITTFSEGIIRNYVERNAVSAIAELCTANGSFPVYETCYAGKKIGLFLSRVGAPACAAGLEEVIAMGAKKLVQFGVCGVLNQDAVGDRLILPSSAVRDEGTSYHYLPGAEEIEADPADAVFIRRRQSGRSPMGAQGFDGLWNSFRRPLSDDRPGMRRRFFFLEAAF